MEEQNYLEFEEFNYTQQANIEDESEDSKSEQNNQNLGIHNHNSHDKLHQQSNISLIAYSKQNQQTKSKNNLSFTFIDPVISNSNKSLNLFTGLQVSEDGVIRFGYCQDQVSFGFQDQRVVKVEQNHRLGLVDIQFSNDCYLSKQQFQEAILFLSHFPNIQYDYVSSVLNNSSFLLNDMRSNLASINYQESKDFKNQEFSLFIKHCQNYLEFFCQNSPNQMFFYQILRLNIFIGDSEIAHIGYSKQYLDLLGIDGSSLSQIYLRNKQLDLYQNKDDITYQSLQGLSTMSLNLDEESISTSIITFDGFPIRLNQKKKSVQHGYKSQLNAPCEYGFSIIEIDVDLYDLEQLIQYRQRLVEQQSNLEYDDLIRKELSYKFEDVEYSVHSQSLINKYYSDNILKLQSLYLKKKLNKNNRQSISQF